MNNANTDNFGTDRLTQGDLERLEPCAVKVACTVLRGRWRSNALLLPDIHTAWNLRFTPLIETYPTLRLHHFTHGQDALNFLATLKPEKKDHVIFLSDYELLHQDRNGLQIIEASQINNAILVTSYYSNPTIRDTATQLNVKILPKQMASVIPINMDTDMSSYRPAE